MNFCAEPCTTRVHDTPLPDCYGGQTGLLIAFYCVAETMLAKKIISNKQGTTTVFLELSVLALTSAPDWVF
jgi:hypothetical protein